jgi:GNAT superfamily N-acetyltransferase
VTEIEYGRGDYTISTDKSRLDLEMIHDYLSNRSYWATGRTQPIIQKSIEHSICFGVYEGTRQVGFARLVTDYATFAWLCDVFVLESDRGRGLGKWLVECAVSHPDVQGLRLMILGTRDAHELYRRYGGFEILESPERWMARRTT